MISMLHLYHACLDALPFECVYCERFVFCGFFYASDVFQPREFLIEAHIPAHASAICLWQRRLG